jgi:hypothetical protein
MTLGGGTLIVPASIAIHAKIRDVCIRQHADRVVLDRHPAGSVLSNG